MVASDSTPEFVSKVYETMQRNLEIVRRRVGRPITLADKLLLSHMDDPENQELIAGRSYLQLRPDRVILQDVLGQTAMLNFMQTRRTSTAVPTTVHCDHLVQARVGASPDLQDASQPGRTRSGKRVLGQNEGHQNYNIAGLVCNNWFRPQGHLILIAVPSSLPLQPIRRKKIPPGPLYEKGKLALAPLCKGGWGDLGET